MSKPQMLTPGASHLFTYGTLMFSEIFWALCQNLFMSELVEVEGFSQRLIRHEIYPGAFEQNHGRLVGKLWFHVHCHTLSLLDEFEDDFYTRDVISIKTNSRGVVPAFIYVVRESSRHVLSQTLWSKNFFSKHHLNYYVRRCEYSRASLLQKGQN